MKVWKCTVCGYIHYGDEAPEECPICGSPQELFVEVIESIKEEEAKATESGSSVDISADVLIIGSGAAAFSAAVTAKHEGASVVMLEKADKPGGTTRRSGGGFWTPNNRHMKKRGVVDDRIQAIKYMCRLSFPQLYNADAANYGVPLREFENIEMYFDRAAEMVEHHESIGVFETFEETNWLGKRQVDYQDHLPENGEIRGRCLYSKNEKGEIGYGFILVKHFVKWAEEYDIPILTNHQVTKILKDDTGKVIGVEATTPEGTKTFLGEKGVIFGTGGYTHNPEMLLNFQRGPVSGGCSAPTCTGDFVHLGTEAGAQLGNMNGAFRCQSIHELAISNPEGSNNVFYIPGDSILEVNRYGKRVMDEKRNYNDRTMVHFEWDPNRAEWTNLLLFMIYDQRTATLWQGYPPFPAGDAAPPHIIKADTLESLSEKIAERLESLKAHTGGFTLDEQFTESFKDTVATFNTYAETGVDEDFQRGEFAYDREWTTFPPTVPGAEWPPAESPNYTMYPLSDEGPYYCIILSSGTLDTNGGPMINSKAQVLDTHGEPIPGLYGAGNCISSPTMDAYWGAGSTIGPAMTFGYVAAKHILG